MMQKKFTWNEWHGKVRVINNTFLLKYLYAYWMLNLSKLENVGGIPLLGMSDLIKHQFIRNISTQVLSCHFMSCHVMSCHVIYHNTLHHIISYHITSYHINHIKSYHINHITSYHIIPHHIIHHILLRDVGNQRAIS